MAAEISQIMNPISVYDIRSKLTIVAIVAATALGCGKAEYESQMRTRATNLQLGSGFIENLFRDPEEILGGVAEIRFPTYLSEEAKPRTLRIGQKTRTDNPESPDRIQPPSVKIPGFHSTREMFHDLGGRDNSLPIYWYFGSVSAETKLKSIESQLRADAAKLAPKSKPTFVDVAIATPDGGTIPYRKMSVKGVQSFFTAPDAPDVEKKPGQFDVYIHSSPKVHVIIGIRGADEAINALDAIKNANYALGTLSVLDN